MGKNLSEPSAVDNVESPELDEMLYAAHAEIETLADLEKQRGTPIPALFNQFYKFIQNPSTVSVETFKRMVDTDDTIGSGVDFLTTCLAARIGRYTHPSKEITQWLNLALEKIDNGFESSIKELLGAAWSGFVVQEKVWANDTDLGFIVKKLVSLPPTTILFETERTGELTKDGILQYQRNYNPANLAFGSGGFFGFGFTNSSRGPMRNDPYAKFGDFAFPIRTGNTYSYLSVRIPVEKCIHYAFDASGKFGNPYGRSLLRRAYKWHVMKDAFMQMLSIALDRKGTPLTVVFADPNTTLADPDKSTPGVSNRGRSVGKRADQAALDAFKNIHNDSVIVLPGKKGQMFEVDPIQQDSNSDAFIASIDLCNKSILRAMLVPSLIFGNGDGTGSYSLGQEHAKTFDKILDGILVGLKRSIQNQLIAHLIHYNFPKSAWKKDGIGYFEKVDLSPDEVQKEMSIIETGVNMGAIDMNDLNDLNAVRAKMKLEPRTKPIEREDPYAIMGDDGDDEKNDNKESEAKDDKESEGKKKERKKLFGIF